MLERILRLPEVRTLTGLSRSSIYLRICEGLFPRPVLLGRRMVGWPAREVAAINSARIRGDSENAIRTLVKKLEAQRADAA